MHLDQFWISGKDRNRTLIKRSHFAIFRGLLVTPIEIYINIISIAKAHSHDIDLLFFLIS